MVSFTYLSFLYDLAAGNIKLSDAYRGMLVRSAYTPTDAHRRRSDVIAAEVSGTNYPAGGVAASIGVNRNDSTGKVELLISCAPVPNATLTAGGLVIYRARGGLPAADELVCAVTFGGDRTVTNYTLTPSFGAPILIGRG